MKKGKKAYGIFNMKCPRCHEGDLFPTSTFSFSKSFEMHDRCPHCDLNYMPQPGYYYGAMFISYIMTGFFCLGFVGTLMLGFGWSVNSSFAFLIVIMAIFFVWIFRISRSIWIGINYRYDPAYAKKE